MPAPPTREPGLTARERAIIFFATNIEFAELSVEEAARKFEITKHTAYEMFRHLYLGGIVSRETRGRNLVYLPGPALKEEVGEEA